jgi:electron transport complex protein RnfD
VPQQTRSKKTYYYILIMQTRLFAAPSPHIHGSERTQQIMGDVVLALIPALAVSTYVLGWRVLMITAIAIASCMLFEYLIQRFLLKGRTTLGDLSAVVTGLLLAFNLPAGIPWWIVVIGALVAIGIGKMTFGGLGCNPFNPALTGRIFLLIAYPVQMTDWTTGVPADMQSPMMFDSVSGATSVDAMSGATALPMVKQNPELAVFLRKLESLRVVMRGRTTLVFDTNTAPFDLFKPGAEVLGPVKSKK